MIWGLSFALQLWTIARHQGRRRNRRHGLGRRHRQRDLARHRHPGTSISGADRRFGVGRADISV